MRIYPASKSKHWPFWCALRAAGIPIHPSWIDAPFNHTGGEPPDWTLHWQLCTEEAAAADVVLMYAREDENQNGALIEVGAALAAGRRVFVVSPHDWSWMHHSNVRRFTTLEDAITAIAELNDAGGCGWLSSNTTGAIAAAPTGARDGKGRSY